MRWQRDIAGRRAEPFHGLPLWIGLQRHSPDRLLREKFVLPAAATVSAERHKGRVMLRFEILREEG